MEDAKSLDCLENIRIKEINSKVKLETLLTELNLLNKNQEINISDFIDQSNKKIIYINKILDFDINNIQVRNKIINSITESIKIKQKLITEYTYTINNKQNLYALKMQTLESA